MGTESSACVKESQLGAFRAEINQLKEENKTQFSTLAQITETLHAIAKDATKGDAELTKSFTKIETLLTVQNNKLDEQALEQKKQSDVLNEVKTDINSIKTEMNHINEDMTNHKTESDEWEQNIEKRLSKLETIRIFVYAFFVILGITAFVLIRMNDTWSAMEEIVKKTTGMSSKENVQMNKPKVIKKDRASETEIFE